MIKNIRAFLEEKGIQYELPDQTLVKFSLDGLNFLFQYREEDDPQFIRILLPRVENVNGNEADVFKRMIDVSSSIKVVKSIVSNNEVWLAAEQFMSSTDNIAQVFDRMISVLRLAYNHYASIAASNKIMLDDETV